MRLDELNLFELTGIKHMYEKDLDDILKALEEKGSMVKGKGSFGLVLKHTSKPEVIKFWIEDKSYDDFIEYVSKNPSPWFPKLYSKPKSLTSFFMRPAEFPNKIKYVRMEELTYKAPDISEHYVQDLFKSPSLMTKAEFVERYSNLMDRSKEKDGLGTYDKKYLETLMLFVTTKPEIEKFYDFINGIYEELIKKKGHSYDIHSENVMMRGKQLVITDPIFNTKDHGISKTIRNGLDKLAAFKSNPDELSKIARKSGKKIIPIEIKSIDGKVLYTGTGTFKECVEKAVKEGVDLSKANFKKVRLDDANLKGAKLHGANLSEASVSDVDFTDADLSNVDFSYAYAGYAIYDNAKMNDANLSSVYFGYSKFNGTDMTGVKFDDDTSFSRAKFHNAKMSGVVKAKIYQEGGIFKGEE